MNMVLILGNIGNIFVILLFRQHLQTVRFVYLSSAVFTKEQLVTYCIYNKKKR